METNLTIKKAMELLGLSQLTPAEDIEAAFNNAIGRLYLEKESTNMKLFEFDRKFDELAEAKELLVAEQKRIIEDALLKEAETKRKLEQARAAAAAQSKAVIPAGAGASKQSREIVRVSDPYSTGAGYTGQATSRVVKKEEKKNPAGKILLGVAAGVVTIAICAAALRGCSKDYGRTGARLSTPENKASITQVIDNNDTELNTPYVTPETTPAVPVTVEPTVEAPVAGEPVTEAPVQEVPENAIVIDSVQSAGYGNQEYVVDLGDISDDTLVWARAQELTDQLAAAGIGMVVDLDTTVPYTTEHIFKLIKFANGYYIPDNIPEIDELYLDLLNLGIAPINNVGYGNHIQFAQGNDDYARLVAETPLTHVGYAEAFCAYGQNGVYPLVQWMQQKRFDIYNATSREEINAIWREVGQVMADLMKGNGCTITLYDGKEAKEGITYTFTSEQVLANHSSAWLIMTESQLIFANHYRYVYADGRIDETPTTWEVYNHYNSDGVDANGYPIIKPDIVSYEEINAWINGMCEINWEIEEITEGGKTYGERVQLDIEGMALNNYKAAKGQKTLTK